ncbi:MULTISPECIES: PepSY domain-containing protein [Shinella]|uniref:PepSY domain-containing protein n=1 Tax=Shinella TaxID=323620 RepID=UPI0009E994D2
MQNIGYVFDVKTNPGLDVRRIKVENGCYEVYAIDAKGAKVETIFNPQTGEPVGSEGAE